MARFLMGAVGVIVGGLALVAGVLVALATHRCGVESTCDNPARTSTVVAQVVLGLGAIGAGLGACASAFLYASTGEVRQLRLFVGCLLTAVIIGGLWVIAFQAAIS